jgi:hypothetical protein
VVIDTKITSLCIDCGENKIFPDEFVAGRKNHCKKCRNLVLKNKRDLNKKPKPPKQTREEKIKYSIEWNKKNPERRKEIINKYHETHKKEEKSYRDEHREEICIRVSKYQKENRDILNIKLREKRKDTIIKLRHNVSSLIRFYMNGSKSESIGKYFPENYIKQLKEHIEKQFLEPGNEWMTWENWGQYKKKYWNDQDKTTWKWQLDHIIPQSDLPYNTMDHPNFQKAWRLDNLRPLSAKQNQLDGSRKTRHKNKQRKQKGK